MSSYHFPGGPAMAEAEVTRFIEASGGDRCAFFRRAAALGPALPTQGGLMANARAQEATPEAESEHEMGEDGYVGSAPESPSTGDESPVPMEAQPFTVYDPILKPVEPGPKEITVTASDATVYVGKDVPFAPDLAEPDQAVFDLDPGDEATFDDVLQAALRLRDELTRLDLGGYAKTSGRRGLHVHVPLTPGHEYAAVRAWVKGVAKRLEETHGELIAVARGATHQGNRVTIDYAQNSIARTMAAPYTARAVEGAPVAAPLRWDEVAVGQIRPVDLNLRTMQSRLQAVGDPLAPILQGGQRLPL